MITKASDGKPVAGRSPSEVDRALRNCILSEDQLLAICSLANSS